MGRIIEFYAVNNDNDLSQKSSEETIPIVREHGFFIESISINSSVIAQALSHFSKTSLAKIGSAEEATALIIPRTSFKDLQVEVNALPQVEVVEDLVEAITAAIEDASWRGTALAIVLS